MKAAQAKEIARSSRHCNKQGFGPVVAVFADGSHDEAPMAPVGRQGEKGVEWAKWYISRPATVAQVREICR